jgi:Leucine-rich repeat (LRR) protein
MKKIIVLLLLITNILFAKSAFIKMCKNPTPSQKATLEAIVSENKFLFKTEDFDEVSCDKIEYLLKNRGYVTLNNSKVTDLTPIQYFPNLTSVYIDRKSNVSDLAPLLKLKNLKELRIIDNPITDISIFTKLTNITTLSIHSKDLQDISPIKNLVNLMSNAKVKYTSSAK